jgi:hypothetical protein
MNKQEVFDKVWNHFIVNNGPPSLSSEGCCYRGPNGAKCAIGIFIADEDYTDEMEGCAVSSLLRISQSGHPGHRKLILAIQKSMPGLDVSIDNEDVLFLNKLQETHDESAHLDIDCFHICMKKRLVKFAERFNLEVSE